MTQATAEVHLKRAYGLIQEVQATTEEFRRRALAHDAQINSDQPFLEGMVGTIRGNRQLSQKKSALMSDLQLASEEIQRAMSVDGDATVEIQNGQLDALQLKALILYAKGQLEMIWGTSQRARQFLSESLQAVEMPDTHYMLGLLYESEYQPTEALGHFERCLELDPAGELSVAALREANSLKNYKKRFRGSWGIFLFLFIIFFPLALVYFFVKRK